MLFVSNSHIVENMLRIKKICRIVLVVELQVKLWDNACNYFVMQSLFCLAHCVFILNDVSVKPRRGDALLFFSLHPDATTDQSSLHAGCPVLEGEKWSATKWIHVDSFDKTVSSTDGSCTDQNASCERWAALGECTKNPEYMVGTPELPGFCRRSCHVC